MLQEQHIVETIEESSVDVIAVSPSAGKLSKKHIHRIADSLQIWNCEK